MLVLGKNVHTREAVLFQKKVAVQKMLAHAWFCHERDSGQRTTHIITLYHPIQRRDFPAFVCFVILKVDEEIEDWARRSGSNGFLVSTSPPPPPIGSKEGIELLRSITASEAEQGIISPK